MSPTTKVARGAQPHFKARLEGRTARAFRADPEGGYVAGDSWFYFAFAASLFGYVIWGRPTPEDVRALVRLLEVELDRPLHDALVDLSGLEAVDPDAFAALARYTVEQASARARIIRRTAIVRPAGLNGAIVTGFFDMAAKPFPVSFASTVAGALADLGRADATAQAASLAEARAAISNEPALLRSVRAHLATDLRSPSLPDAARALGVGPRTLQRRLGELGTSFEAQLVVERMKLAERLLADTDTPVSTIAIDLGFASPQHFATVFRRQFGTTPSAFRATPTAR